MFRRARARGAPFRKSLAGPRTAPSLWLGYRIERALGDPTAATEYAERMKMEFPTAAATGALLEAERGTQ